MKLAVVWLERAGAGAGEWWNFTASLAGAASFHLTNHVIVFLVFPQILSSNPNSDFQH